MGQEDQRFLLTQRNDGQSSFWMASIAVRHQDYFASPLSTYLLRLSIAQDIAVDDVVFEVAEPPTSGSIGRLSQNLQGNVSGFDLDAVRRGEIVYSRAGSDVGGDQFVIQAPFQQVFRDLKLELVRAAHMLHLRHCQKVEVPVGGSILLGKDQLEAVSPDENPDEVLFTASRPQHGQLIYQSDTESAVEISSFSQTMLNEGKIVYQHIGGKSGEDHFRFNVTDQNGTLESRQFNIRITNS